MDLKKKRGKDGPAHPEGRNLVIKRRLRGDWAKKCKNIFWMYDVSLIIHTQVSLIALLVKKHRGRRLQEVFVYHIQKMARPGNPFRPVPSRCFCLLNAIVFLYLYIYVLLSLLFN